MHSNVKIIVLLILALMAFVNELHATSGISYFIDETAKANALFKQGKVEWVLHEKNIIDTFQENKSSFIDNPEICKLVYDAYTSLAQLNKQLPVEDNINYRKDALLIINENPVLGAMPELKQSIVDCYVGLSGLLYDDGLKAEAIQYNIEMIEYARKHYTQELTSVLLTACALNSVMGEFELNKPVYNELYEHFEELDKRQKYKVVQEQLHFAFKDERYDKVLELATLHSSIIIAHNGDAKDVILDLIGKSYLESINSMLHVDKAYSSRIESQYIEGYRWLKEYNPRMLPMLVVNWGYDTYSNPSTKIKAIDKFYEYLDLIQADSKDSTIFSNQYANVEDAQNALTSIIVTDVINNNPPKNLRNNLNQYQNVLKELFELGTGQYLDDLKDAIAVAMDKSDNSQNIDN